MADEHEAEGSQARRTRIVLALPHMLMLEAMQHLLEASGLKVAARCDRAAELEQCLRLHQPDVALIDALLADDGDIAELIRAARRGLGGGRLVLLVDEITPSLAREALAMDIEGVLLKGAHSSGVVARLDRIAAGDAVFPAGWLAAARRAGDSERDTLSARQLQVLELLAQGLPNELIAERLFISRNTVKFHVAAIYQRLGVTNRVMAAQALGTLRAAG